MSEVMRVLSKKENKQDGFIKMDGIVEALLTLEKEIIELRGLLSEKIVWQIPNKIMDVAE